MKRNSGEDRGISRCARELRDSRFSFVVLFDSVEGLCGSPAVARLALLWSIRNSNSDCWTLLAVTELKRILCIYFAKCSFLFVLSDFCWLWFGAVRGVLWICSKLYLCSIYHSIWTWQCTLIVYVLFNHLGNIVLGLVTFRSIRLTFACYAGSRHDNEDRWKGPWQSPCRERYRNIAQANWKTGT